jgi:6,7-dimethyl-8-ribityllumazine synthase
VSKFSPRPLDGRGRNLAIAVSHFNNSITERLLAGAMEALLESDVRKEDVTITRVPGTFELPLASKWLAQTGKYDAVLALGAVIRGETPHFDYICSQASRGIMQVSLETGVPVIFGVLTCDNSEQAIERAGGRAGNKGAEAALAGLEMAALADAGNEEKDAGKYGREA